MRTHPKEDTPVWRPGTPINVPLLKDFASSSDDADLAKMADGAADEIERLRGLLWFAWFEFNAFRRYGAPVPVVSTDWWGEITDAFGDAIGVEAQTPWPSPDAKTEKQGEI